MVIDAIKRKFDWIIGILFFTLIIGTPMIFTSLTRSVFEVNKLLLLRVIILLVYGVWLFRTLWFSDNDIDDTDGQDTYKIGPWKWKKTGLEWPFIAWIILNIVSTALSQNARISIIGAYDRWEGIITLFNYAMLFFMVAKLTTRRFQVALLLFGVLLSTGLSSFYGIFQSLGYDFMNWSADPTFRVFACINNPVHYCAYVGMVTPLGFGTLLFLSKKYPALSETLPVTSGLKWVKAIALVLSLALIKHYVFPEFDVSYMQMVLLVASSWLIADMTREPVPTQRSIVLVATYLGLIFASIGFKILNFNGFQWFGFAISSATFLTLSALPDWQSALKRLTFITTIMIFYTQILSFSRATWVGFLLVMPLFVMMVTNSFIKRTPRTFYTDVAVTLGTIGTFTLFNVFEVRSAVLALITLAGCHYMFYALKSEDPNAHTYSFIKQLCFTGLALLSIASFLFIIPEFESLPIGVSFLPLPILMLALSQLNGYARQFMARVLIIVFFSQIQTAGSEWRLILFQFSLLSGYYYVTRMAGYIREFRFWLITFISFLFITLIVPYVLPLGTSVIDAIVPLNYPLALLWSVALFLGFLYILILMVGKEHLFNTTKKKAILLLMFLVLTGSTSALKYQNTRLIDDSETLKAAVYSRSKDYEGQLQESARISMWKSAIPWFKDHFLIGTGPDTVKFMYPVYRRSEYGILEGGHNFTPDRLHNEYINTLVTRGSIGFLIYYVGIILMWAYLILKWCRKNEDNPYQYVAVGAMIGGGVYLGQVLFNFGVVATLVLFYFMMGLSLAFTLHSEFQNHESE